MSSITIPHLNKPEKPIETPTPLHSIVECEHITAPGRRSDAAFFTLQEMRRATMASMTLAVAHVWSMEVHP